MNSHLALQLRTTRVAELGANSAERCDRTPSSSRRLRRAHEALRAWLSPRA